MQVKAEKKKAEDAAKASEANAEKSLKAAKGNAAAAAGGLVKARQDEVQEKSRDEAAAKAQLDTPIYPKLTPIYPKLTPIQPQFEGSARRCEQKARWQAERRSSGWQEAFSPQRQTESRQKGRNEGSDGGVTAGGQGAISDPIQRHFMEF